MNLLKPLNVIPIKKNVHTFSVVKCLDKKNDYKYFGYSGPVNTGKIVFWVSENLVNWKEEKTILNHLGYRWPSVITIDNKYYMAIGDEKKIFQNYINSRIARLFDYIFLGKLKTFIALYTSNDGIDFSYEKILIPIDANKNPYNQNPFFFKDPVSKNVCLFYYSGDNKNNFEIRVKYGKKIEEIEKGKDIKLLLSEKVLAAPGVFYDHKNKRYWLLTEAKENDKWAVKAFHSDKLLGNYEEFKGNPIIKNDTACPFPFVKDNKVYLFVSKRFRKNNYWKEFVYVYNIW